jgi:hypothetical protein
VLDRLANGDLLTARTLLQLMLDSLHVSTAPAAPEYAPFAYSLALQLQELVTSRRLSASSSFWGVAVRRCCCHWWAQRARCGVLPAALRLLQRLSVCLAVVCVRQLSVGWALI